MSAIVTKYRRGTSLEHSTFTGENGEVTLDETKKTLVVHDGSTVGGTTLATEQYVINYTDTSISNLSTVYASITGNENNIFKANDGVAVKDVVNKGQLDNGLATKSDTTHNHDTQYLGITSTASDSNKWQGSSKTVSTSTPSGGVDGDIWFQY